MKWAGQAFSYLMHHPQNPHGSDSYYKASQRTCISTLYISMFLLLFMWVWRAGEQIESEAPRQGNVGTWQGPAPRGQGIAPRHVRYLL